jgi:hypothetical protein
MTDQVRGVTDAVVEFISCGRGARVLIRNLRSTRGDTRLMRAILSLSELILEDVVAVPDPEGRFELHVRFDSR